MSSGAPVRALYSLVLVRAGHVPCDLEDVWVAQPVVARVAVVAADVLDGPTAQVERVERAPVREPDLAAGDPQLAPRGSAIRAELQRALLDPAAVGRDGGDTREAPRRTRQQVADAPLDRPASGELSGHGAGTGPRRAPR